MTRLARQWPLMLGALVGLAAILLARAALDPARWFPDHLGRVYVIGTCSYSRVAVDMLAADPSAPWIAVPVPSDAAAFNEPACARALGRLTAEGAWWLALVPTATACDRLQRWGAERFDRETPGEGFPAWVDGHGQFRGLGVDPATIASLGLTPTPQIVDFWVDGGYERAVVESHGFRVPARSPAPGEPARPAGG
jgi:hypothetical protein